MCIYIYINKYNVCVCIYIVCVCVCVYIYIYIYIERERERESRDSSVGMATRYGLDGPVIESRWGQDFLHPSRPALGPTQPPVQWVPGLSRG